MKYTLAILEDLKFVAAGRCRLKVMLTLLISGLSGCASVQETHLNGWIGQPLAALTSHPTLMALPVVRTITPDGSRLWRYVDGFNPSKCSEGSRVFSADVSYKTYERFAVCMSGEAACNHIFHIANTKIVSYSLIATGVAICNSNAKWSPGYRGAAN